MRRDPRHDPAAQRESGVALLLAALLGVALLGGWLLAWRATHDTIRVDRYLVDRAERSGSVAQGLADGVALLEDGLPPNPLCEYLVTFPASPRPIAVTVSFTQLSDLEWDVSARLATPSEAVSLLDLPESF